MSWRPSLTNSTCKHWAPCWLPAANLTVKYVLTVKLVQIANLVPRRLISVPSLLHWLIVWPCTFWTNQIVLSSTPPDPPTSTTCSTITSLACSLNAVTCTSQTCWPSCPLSLALLFALTTTSLNTSMKCCCTATKPSRRPMVASSMKTALSMSWWSCCTSPLTCTATSLACLSLRTMASSLLPWTSTTRRLWPLTSSR